MMFGVWCQLIFTCDVWCMSTQVAFFRQFFRSVTKVDFLTLRQGFINVRTKRPFFLAPPLPQRSKSFSSYHSDSTTIATMISWIFFPCYAGTFVAEQQVRLPQVHQEVDGGRLQGRRWHQVGSIPFSTPHLMDKIIQLPSGSI